MRQRMTGWTRGRCLGITLLVGGSVLLAAIPLGAAGYFGSPRGSETFEGAVGVPSGTHCTVGKNPHTPAYDPVDRDIYVPNSGSGNLSILSDSCKLVKTITFPSGAQPNTAAFDPENNTVYVTDSELNQVYVLSGSKLVGTVTCVCFDSPWGIAYDPFDQMMVVANANSNTVAFLLSSEEYSASIVGSSPRNLAWDPTLGCMEVSNSGSNSVSSLCGGIPYFTGTRYTVPVGADPVGVVFAPGAGLDFVANAGSDNVSIINPGSQGSLVYTVPSEVSVGSQPRDLAWDQAASSVFVVNYGSNNISEIHVSYDTDTVTKTLAGPAGAGLFGIAYCDATGQVFVTGYDNDQVYVYG